MGRCRIHSTFRSAAAQTHDMKQIRRILQLALMLGFAILFFRNCGQPMPPTGLLGRGGVFLVIDLPATAPHGVERVIVARERRGVLAIRGPQITVLPNRELAPRSFVWLTQPQWEPIEALRQR